MLYILVQCAVLLFSQTAMFILHSNIPQYISLYYSGINIVSLLQSKNDFQSTIFSKICKPCFRTHKVKIFSSMLHYVSNQQSLGFSCPFCTPSFIQGSIQFQLYIFEVIVFATIFSKKGVQAQYTKVPKIITQVIYRVQNYCTLMLKIKLRKICTTRAILSNMYNSVLLPLKTLMLHSTPFRYCRYTKLYLKVSHYTIFKESTIFKYLCPTLYKQSHYNAEIYIVNI